MNDLHFMNQAYQEALKAFDEGEVPVGAVVVRKGAVIGRGHNRCEHLVDATAHAEIIALGAASQTAGTWRLVDCTMYVTLEPCLMCLGALLQARLQALVYASADPRCGAIESFFYRQEAQRAYRRFPRVTSGIMEDRCSELLKSFFARRRNER